MISLYEKGAIVGKKNTFEERIADQLRSLDVEIVRLQAKANQAKARVEPRTSHQQALFTAVHGLLNPPSLQTV